MHDLFLSAEAKYRRAIDHFDLLDSELTAHGRDHIQGAIKSVSLDGTKWTWHLALGEPANLDRWGAIIGECLFDLRSSLDNALYGLAIKASNANPPPGERELQFPIADEPSDFRKQRWHLADLRNTPYEAGIKLLQPYKRPHPPYRPMLSYLRDFNDRDKHRVYHVLAGGMEGGDVRWDEIIPSDAVLIEHDWAAIIPLEDGAQLCSLTFDRQVFNVNMASRQNIYACFEIKLADGTDWLTPCDNLLNLLRAEVRWCLDEMVKL
ncbi:MAG: hypothetical protein GEU75_01520 [Dehalococcoidia bacterium]|nr:hypothetical protein [Dehalococcoidia bacterium]